MKNMFFLKCLMLLGIVFQVYGVLFELNFILFISLLITYAFVFLYYWSKAKKIHTLGIFIMAICYLGTLFDSFIIADGFKIKLWSFIISYLLLFYFSYENSKSFDFSKRDIFTLLVGSTLYTVIFFMLIMLLESPAGELKFLVISNLLLLYLLLIAAGMHYVNIRSEKSMWFFLVILSFAVSDFGLLINKFYLEAKELQVLNIIYRPFAIFFLVHYLTSSPTVLKSETLENF